MRMPEKPRHDASSGYHASQASVLSAVDQRLERRAVVWIRREQDATFVENRQAVLFFRPRAWQSFDRYGQLPLQNRSLAAMNLALRLGERRKHHHIEEIVPVTAPRRYRAVADRYVIETTSASRLRATGLRRLLDQS